MMNATAIVLFATLAQVASQPAGQEAKAKAQALMKEGARLYERGDLADALEKFEQAYAQYPSPKLLFNIGQTSRGLGHPIEALDAFEHFLAEADDAPADMMAEARLSMSELQAKVGRLLIECSKEGAEISVDGKSVGVAPITNLVRVTPGTHKVAARHPGSTPAYESVDVNAGTVHTVVMRLQPVAAAVAEAGSAAPKAAADADLQTVPASRSAAGASVPTIEQPAASVSTVAVSPRAPNRGWWLGRKWTWVAAGSSVVLAGGAILFGVSMQSKFDDLEKSCGSRPGGCSEGDIDSVALRRNMANVFWGVAGAAAVTAGVLFFVEGRPVSVAPMAGTATGLLARVGY